MEKLRQLFKRRGNIDYSLLFIVLFLLAFGLVMLYSTSSYEAAAEYKDAASTVLLDWISGNANAKDVVDTMWTAEQNYYLNK